ncbi:hypothetical protein FACS189447_03300 [Spirochaetia bacterium]|nr:hypothetical protein FACS189447_03300 [Spirochaetia bacterium]
MIEAVSVKKNVILRFSKPYTHRLERKFKADGEWLVLTAAGFVLDDGGITPEEISGPYLDTAVTDGVYQYRERKFDDPNAKYEVSLWVRCGDAGAVGYTFNNYASPEGDWGEILTPDDLRYTWMWGLDARATNGQSYTDDQIRFHINSSLAEMERRLNITIRKKRIACEPERRGLKPKIDYDEEESFYKFRREKIQRNGMISTRHRPVISISRLDLLSRKEKTASLLETSTLDKTKGLISLFNRPLRVGDTSRAIQQSLYAYGEESFNRQLFYAIDYVAGFESSDAVPDDLRAAIGKMCAIELLNIIGDGILAGFSSSSLSMDGVSESFSSTQSATSATYGARIKEYGEELDGYIKANKMKFGHVVMGAL